jgi:DNA-directed RNA polymerase specialized sigma24 family protein
LAPNSQLTDDMTWRDLRSVLDEELALLPDKWRQPLILCYLEGRTQDEAASQLGWSKSTLRRRLDDFSAVIPRFVCEPAWMRQAAATWRM